MPPPKRRKLNSDKHEGLSHIKILLTTDKDGYRLDSITVESEDDQDYIPERTQVKTTTHRRQRRSSTASKENHITITPIPKVVTVPPKAKEPKVPQTPSVGNEIFVLWDQDHKYHPCKILETKKRDNETMYYVHFIEFDRRMDQWTTPDQILKADQVKNINPGKYVSLVQALETARKYHYDEGHQDADEKKHQEATKVKNLNSICIGKYEMETWYYSPFPLEFSCYNKLYFCEFCFSYFGHDSELRIHEEGCDMSHPPGDEIYRSKEHNVEISVFEVDGAKNQQFCENICLIAKLFLDHKTVFFDTKIFLFYVLCERYSNGCHMVGYFSKEKPPHNHSNNLACILTLPCHQKKGYGKFLISLSYELSVIEGKPGTPETPLSDLGRVSYESYWKTRLVSLLIEYEGKSISVADISLKTGIRETDVRYVLDDLLNVLRYEQGEFRFELSDDIAAKYTKTVM